MKKWAAAIVAIFISLVTGINLHAQPTPPGGGSGGSGTNDDYDYTNIYSVAPYVPGLKLFIPAISGTNLFINLREADPAGTYDIFAASNLVGAAWSDVLQGTNSQTNFTLPFPFTGTGFFRAARTDTPITNAANVTVSFPNLLVNTNLITANVVGGPAAATAVLVNDTNFTDAVWLPFSAFPYVLLGTTDGTYDVWFGFRGSDGTDYWSEVSVTLDTTQPQIVITCPTNNATSKPMIQLKGYSPEPLASLTFNVTNSQGVVSSDQGLVTDQYFDTNLFELTTNWFECLDVGLTLGTNYVSIQATDRAGNLTVTNFVYVFNTNGDATAPAITLIWPQDGMQIGGTNFTLRGLLDDETATVTVQTVDTNGATNVFSGLVERDGKFWAENLPLSSGTNFVTVSATDFAGNTSTTNLVLVQSAVSITIDPIPSNELHQLTATVTGTVSDPSYSVSVNGVIAAVDGGGNWTATNAPINDGGTACFDAAANSAGQPPSNQSTTTNKPPYVYVQSYNYTYGSSVNDYSHLRALPITENFSMSWTYGNGGTEDQDSFNLVAYTNVTLNLQIHDAWPADPAADGTQTTTANGVSTNTTIGPPSIPSEVCKTNGVGYFDTGFGSADGVRTANFSRSAKTSLHYFTGGKSLSLKKNLHQVSVSVNQQIFTWWFGGGSLSSGDAITNGITAGVFGAVGTDGNSWKALADGQDVDVTPETSSTVNYNFSVSAQKYILVVQAGGVNLDPDSVVDGATNFWVGQYLNFTTGFIPSLPEAPTVTASLWGLDGIFVNDHTNANAQSSDNYFENSALLTYPSTHAWWVAGNNSTAFVSQLAANFGEGLTFANGQSVIVTAKGLFDMIRPQTQVTTVTGTVVVDDNFEDDPIALHYGDKNDIPGITFHNTVAITNGSIQWLQVINSKSVGLQKNNGSWIRPPAVANALDNTDPYGHYDNDVNTTADSPGFAPRFPSVFQTLTRSDNFTMWLEFNPGGGIWVPLRKEDDWLWYGTAVRSGTNTDWVLTSDPTPDTNPSDSDTTVFPAWTNTATNLMH